MFRKLLDQVLNKVFNEYNMKHMKCHDIIQRQVF